MLLKSVFPFIHVAQATENKLLKYASPVKRHWVMLTDRCWFSKISEGSEAITMSLLQAFFFPHLLDPIASPIDSFIFFWSVVFKTSHSTSASQGWGGREDSCGQHPCWCSFAFFTKAWRYCSRSAAGQQEPFCQRLFPGRSLAMLSTSCIRAAHGAGWSVGLSAHVARLNRTLCFFQAISLIVGIILNSVLACRILAIPCSFSWHQ